MSRRKQNLNYSTLGRMSVIYDLMEYTDQSKKEVSQKCLSAVYDLAEEWEKLNPQTTEEITDFYRNSPYYIYDLTLWHYKIFQKKVDVVDRMKDNLLDYGAGIGTNLILAWAGGLRNLTYVDLRGNTWDYAEWRFKKHDMDVTMIDAEKDLNKLDMYDSLICEEVLEHIPEWEKTALMLISHMHIGAIYYIKTTFQNMASSEAHPMHLNTDTHPRDFFKKHGKKGKYFMEW